MGIKETKSSMETEEETEQQQTSSVKGANTQYEGSEDEETNENDQYQE